MKKYSVTTAMVSRPGRSCHDAIRQALEYLNDGYEWVVDIDIEQFFDKVNHDKLIQILREQVNDSTTLNLIRKYLKSGRNGKRSGKSDCHRSTTRHHFPSCAQISIWINWTKNWKAEDCALQDMRMMY